MVPWQVIFRDIDAFGHVNNAVYLTYFEWARTQLWFDLTGGSDPTDVGFIVARAECDFVAQIEMEAIDIRVRVGEMRNTSFDTHYEIRDYLQWNASKEIVMQRRARTAKRQAAFRGTP